MTKISYKGSHKEFIKELFATDFIRSSELTSTSFIEQLLNKIATKKRNKGFIYPTDLFSRLNNACGDTNPDLDYEIFLHINSFNLSSQTILSLLISDLLSSNEQSLKKNLGSFSEEDEEMNGLTIEELFLIQHDSLPCYLFKKITYMIYNFASEFDISDGRIDFETYNDKIKYYSNLELYNEQNYF
ncbi:hypothetical protein [Sphingobacterium sp. NPDC055346]